jgi:hypothetical protein
MPSDRGGGLDEAADRVPSERWKLDDLAGEKVADRH